MLKHDYFEMLCSLAVIGDLSDAEMSEFISHRRECNECQKLSAEFSELTSEAIPLAHNHPQAGAPLGREAREAVLRRVSAEGYRISSEAIRGPIGLKDRMSRWRDDIRWTLFSHRREFAITSAMLLIAGIAALAIRYDQLQQWKIRTLEVEVTNNRDFATHLQTEVAQKTEAQGTALAGSQQLEQQLADAMVRYDRLELEKTQTLAKIASLNTAVDQLTAQNGSLVEKTKNDEAELMGLRSQIQQLRNAADGREAEIVSARYQVTELTNQLRNQQIALDREQQLLSEGRDIRDVIGARNLHIIDVHDMDARGEARPFGRIFLTEGKRLIFYAYDLGSTHPRNASFQAWGQRVDGSKNAVNLGILFMDDQKQSRWALKVEDPTLLSTIDSIFVTVEPHGGTQKPTGKKLMYAYLKNPINHP